MDELFTLMAAAFVIYLLLTGVSDVALWALEKRYSHGVVRACPMNTILTHIPLVIDPIASTLNTSAETTELLCGVFTWPTRAS